MELYFFIVFTLYYVFLLLIIYGWHVKVQHTTNEPLLDMPFTSVIVAVRNEEKNIVRLMKCFEHQTMPRDRFEVLFVDDSSTDNTAAAIEKFVQSSGLKFRLLRNVYHPNLGMSPKKAALQKGIEEAHGELIVMTDGDCWFGKNWLKSMVSPFLQKKVLFSAGPVALRGERNLISKIQSLEFASLIGAGGALINLGYPLMCNGANLAFRKSEFYNVGGYGGFEDKSSGDDVFLMQKIHKLKPGSVAFNMDQLAMVYSYPQRSLSDLIHQRRRWASKWNQYLLPFSWMLAPFLFLHYVTFICCLLAAILSPGFIIKALALIFIKFILDHIFLKKVMDFCKLRLDFRIFLLSEFIYPFYAILIGLAVQFGTYKWKGRKHIS